jgi:hypothetical protein
MLPEAESSLSLLQASPRRLLARSLGPSLPLPTKRLVRVSNTILLAVALDLRHAAIPCLPLRRIARPLPQLLRDVGGRGDTGGRDRNLATLCEDAIRNGQLLPRGTRGDDQLASLGLKTGEPLQGPGFVAVDPCQLVLAETTLQLLRPLALRVVALDLPLDSLDPLLLVS